MLFPTDAMMKNKDTWEIDDESGRFVALETAPPEVIKDIEKLNKEEDEADNDSEMLIDF